MQDFKVCGEKGTGNATRTYTDTSAECGPHGFVSAVLPASRHSVSKKVGIKK